MEIGSLKQAEGVKDLITQTAAVTTTTTTGTEADEIDVEEEVTSSEEVLEEEEDDDDESGEDTSPPLNNPGAQRTDHEHDHDPEEEDLEDEEDEDDEEGSEDEEEEEEDDDEDEPTPPPPVERSPHRPLPQHRPQLPLRSHPGPGKRRGKTPGAPALLLGSSSTTSGIKRARGAGIRSAKPTSSSGSPAAVPTGAYGKVKSLINTINMRVDKSSGGPSSSSRRYHPTNTNPIFLHNSSSDEEEEEDEDEEDDLGDEYLERDESDEEEDEDGLAPPGFLLPSDGDPLGSQGIPPDAQARLEAFFEAAGFTDGKLMSDPETLRKLTLTVSSALGEASAAINRMRDSQKKYLEEGRSDSVEDGDSLLALACSSGYFELARVLLAMGANVDDRGSKGDLTPLMDAASQGHLEIVRLLIQHGADVNAQSACGNSPLMYACAAGHIPVVEELLKVGANVEDNNENGHTPLMEAASAGHVDVARLLLEAGAGINTHSNEFKESALTVACYKGHLDMVRFLLEAGADQQHKTDEMHTALMEASMDGHVEVARLLLDSGAQVNMPADSFESPLTLAACGGHVELTDLLLERGANIEEVNDEGYTPLMEASREGHLCVVRTLIKNNANINAQTDETHETAITLAACGGFLDVVDLLVKSGADIEIGASTPLMEASQEGHLQVVRYLIEKGADLHRESTSSDTALSLACENGHLEVAQYLVEMGSLPEHLSEGGRTPLMKACRGGHVDVIKFLLEKKADVNRLTTSNDHTPLSLACAGGHLAAVEVLLAAGANPYQKLKDNSTMIIEAARGGHTAVIRTLLDYLPPSSKTGTKSNVTASKSTPQNKTVGQPQKNAEANKATPPAKIAATAANSVLRKSRSTSTLDTTGPPQPIITSENLIKTKTQPQASQQQQKSKVIVPQSVKAEIEAAKSLPTQNLMSSATADKKNKSISVTDGAKPSAEIEGQKSQVGTIANVKRPATEPITVAPTTANASTSSITVGTVTPVSPSALAPVAVTTGTTTAIAVPQPPSGPPLVPSQVTTATAISDRPKLKSKPRNKMQGQVSAGTSPGSSSEKGQTPINSPASPASPITPNSGSTTPATAPVGVLTTASSKPAPGGTMQIQLSNASGTATGTVSTKQLKDILSQQFIKSAKVEASLPPLPGGSAGTTTTTTTTTVVVTHGDTETIMDGDNLPPGANEMIMNAAAAAFPLDCFPVTPGIPMNSSEMHVQSYQMSGSADLSGGAPVTATMQTTTIINSSASSSLNNFQQQIFLPHHPAPLPAAFAAAAAAAGLVPPTGAPPPGALKSLGLNKNHEHHPPPPPAQPSKPVSSHGTPSTRQYTAIRSGPPPVPVNQVPSVSQIAAPVGQKKQLAKRSRPLPPPSGCQRQSNQQTQSHTHAHAHSHPTGVKNQSVASTQTALTGQQPDKPIGPVCPKHFDVNSATESSGESSLSIAAASGHYEVVEFLLTRNARIEHKDKKGCTPLILASDGGYEKIVELLLNHGADIEAQSERTKDTALSLACTKGRYEVVDLLMKRGANKEHRNVSDYTPLSLAASGGYVNIIKLLLNNGAEINSRTGSKLGISPLMLAAMNGNTAAVKLLLDMGSDINAQIETNKNTALTLACFQGRQEVVSLLLDRKANLEHRAKTGLTPLMEAANGGYTEVGKILIDRGADVNAPSVPATKDTALTIAADKGHYRFVELLLMKGAIVEVRNKKGCTPLWLACNGGHLDVCQILFRYKADLDVQDNRRVSCLMAAFRKGHTKVIRWIVKNVQQFPSDGEMNRYYATIQGEAELLKKCQQSGDYIKQAKDKQALEANKNASILLEELDMERSREESKKQAAARRREKKKKKKQEKKHIPGEGDDDEQEQDDDDEENCNVVDSGIDANSLGSNSSNSTSDQSQKNGGGKRNNKENFIEKEVIVEEEIEEPIPPPPTQTASKNKKKKNRKDKEKDKKTSVTIEEKVQEPTATKLDTSTTSNKHEILKEKENKLNVQEMKIEPKDSKPLTKAGKDKRVNKDRDLHVESTKVDEVPPSLPTTKSNNQSTKKNNANSASGTTVSKSNIYESNSNANDSSNHQYFESFTVHSSKRSNVFDSHDTSSSSTYHHHNANTYSSSISSKTNLSGFSQVGKGGRKDDGWKEVTRSCPSSRSKKVMVPSSVISRVIGRGGCNINAIREATGAHIEVEKQQKGQAQPERTIQIKGSVEATKQAHTLITALMNEPDLDVKKLLPLSSSGSGTNFPPTASTSIPAKPLSSMIFTASSLSESAVALKDSHTSILGKGATPTTKTGKSSVSPPVVHSTTISPPVHKPAPTHPLSSSTFKSGLTTTHHGTKKSSSYIVHNSNSKITQSSVPSVTSVAPTISTFAAKLNQNRDQSHHFQHPTPRTSTPTKSINAPSFTRSSPITVPSSSPSLAGSFNNITTTQILNQQHKGGGLNSQPTTTVMNQFNSSETIHHGTTIKDQAPAHPIRSTQNSVFTSQESTPTANTIHHFNGNNSNSAEVVHAPGPIGSRPNTSTEGNDVPVEPTEESPSQAPLEYSPFNYTFSKTAELFPTELGYSYNTSNNSSFTNSSGMNSVLNSSAARAMNFASVAASGVCTSSINTVTSNMSQANGSGIQNGGLIGSLGGLTSVLDNKQGDSSLLDDEIPTKVDASKAPGYRGASMGSPVLRASHNSMTNSSGLGNENLSGIPSSFSSIQTNSGLSGIMNLAPGNSTGIIGLGNSRQNSTVNMGGLNGLGNSYLGQDLGMSVGNPQGNNSMLFQNNNSDDNNASSPTLPLPTSSTVSTNVIMSSRLNPRAPSFTQMKPPPQQVQQQQQPNVSSYNNQSFSSIHQQQQGPPGGGYKMNSSSGYMTSSRPTNAGMNNSVRQSLIGPAHNSQGNWNSYLSEAPSLDFQNLAALAGVMDPMLFGGTETGLHDMPSNTLKSSDDRRLPRPIGGERNWKNNNASGNGMGNVMPPFGGLDCLDNAQLPQSMSMPQQHQQGWLGSNVFGMQPPPSQFPNPQPNPGMHGPQRQSDTKGFLGRRFIEEMDGRGMNDYQPMFDSQRFMNGSGLGPPGPIGGGPGPNVMPFGGLNVQQPMMFGGFGGPAGDHMEPPLLPKMDQHSNWESHLHMDEKHNLGWGAKWGN